ncbi:flagellar protein FlaG [Thiomicrorhabdus sp.]|uniref:flagellar protein FlaG n=1 Tax=Thiomicrorhabdus sp. TaxID=2039724 RepID=UPI002AA7EBA2|nr:flagellar protein FlaG [Thiomicrorhabdus sp.]
MIDSMQPDSLLKNSSVELPRTIASNESAKVSMQSVSQNVVRQNTDITGTKSKEADGQINAAEIDSQMTSINAQLQKLQNYLKFERDEDSDRMVIFVKDRETGEVIRQIPTQEFLAISKSIGQYLDMSKQLSEKNSPLVGMFTNETV